MNNTQVFQICAKLSHGDEREAANRRRQGKSVYSSSQESFHNSFLKISSLQTTLETLLKVLPNRKQATTQAATTRVLASKAPSEIYLLETPSWMFREEKAKATFIKFSKRLRGIQKEMVQRNKSLNVPYTVLLPSGIPAGISI